MNSYLKGFESNAWNSELIETLEGAIGILYKNSGISGSENIFSDGPIGYELSEMPDNIITNSFEILTCKVAVADPSEDLAKKLSAKLHELLVIGTNDALAADDTVSTSYIVADEPYFTEPFKNLGVNFDLKADVDHRSATLFGPEFSEAIVWTYTFEIRVANRKKS